ncbi:MAG: hypothetical protein HFH86_02145 [Bacilli bacterium]|nr:hypothetical protein [Bacilli bacterium]
MEFSLESQKRLVILFALYELGGSAKRIKVLEYIQSQSYWLKNDQNDETLQTRNEKKWRNDLSFVREHLAREGYMTRLLPGIWSITNKGMNYLNHILIQNLRMVNYDPSFLLSKICFDKIRQYRIQMEQSADSIFLSQVYFDNFNRENSNNSSVPKRRNISKTGSYPRSSTLSRKALQLAGHRCTIHLEHPSFLRRDLDVLYMEPHHFIPIEMTAYFQVNLDVLDNIFCLCSNCHNQIHYGRKEDARQLVETLFSLRKDKICQMLGREITLQELYQIYDIAD